MNERYRVKTVAGVNLDGKIIPQGKTFDSKESYAEWCRNALRSGAIERVETEPKKDKPAS